jgi:hypothetical protein
VGGRVTSRALDGWTTVLGSLDGVRGGGGSASPSWFQICDTGSCGALGSVLSSWTG